MNIEFYFDPSCPFCWITSRWLIQVKDQRNLNIAWKPFSLALKNKAFEGFGEDKYAKDHIAAHRVLRVIEASGGDVGELYTAFGSEKHIMGEDYTDEQLSKVLEKQKLPADLIKAADDTNYDAAIQKSLDEAIEVVGEDVGVPTIIFEIDGQKTGYFGPVLQRLPSVSESLKLWDGLAALATNKDFYELKRSRPSGGPETASTAVCVP